MKKVILLAASLSAMMTLGQASLDPGTKNDIQKIFPTTPETYSMFKAGDFPVDYRTGKLNVSVPLYEIKTRYGVTIPISLTYNTGGIKVDETSGVAGLGWSLSVPNSISVEMHGKDDLENGVWFPQQPGDYATGDLNTFPPDVFYKMTSIKEGVMDSQPDIYHYNLPTVSGSFIKDATGNFRTIPYEDVKISYVDNKFIIIDSKGVIYTLSEGNSTNTISTGSFGESYTSSFILEKIKFPNNEEVSFRYGKKMSYSNITYSFTDIYIPIEQNIADCANSRKSQHVTTNNMYMDDLLTEIIHNDEKLTFSYANTIQGVQGRKDLDGAASGTYALNEIVGTYKDRVIKKMALEHSYFETDGGDQPYKNFRLKLNKVKNLLDNTEYSFEYDESGKPFLGSFSQDIWGYYNGQSNYGLIPNMQYYNRNYTQGGNRNVYPAYSQAYVLKKVQYPTKGSSSFTYENNNVWQTLIVPQEETTPKSNVIGVLNTGGASTENTSSEFYLNENTNVPGEKITYLVDWINSCANNMPGNPGSIQNSNGYGYLEEKGPTGGWNIVAQFQNDAQGPILEAPNSHNPAYKKRLRVMLQSNDPEAGCSVSFSVSMRRVYKTTVNQNAIVGGLRIKSINDFDGQTNYTKRTFEYNKPGNLSTQSSGRIASPLEFLKTHYSVTKPFGSTQQIMCSNYALSADQAVNSSLSGRDVVSYEYVTEHTLGKGKKMYQFSAIGDNLDITVPDMGWNPYQFLNRNVLNEKSYSETGALLQEKSYEYENILLKNPLSSDHIPNSPYSLALSTSFAFFELNSQTFSKINNFYVVESGKWLLNKATHKTYLNNTLTSETNNTYSISDINKPVNLVKTETRSFDGSAAEATFQYATDQNNTDMISANMLGIPIQTEGTENGKVIAKNKTVYAKNLATNNMILPVATQKFDKDNPASAKNTVDYNQYDVYGNVLQYTTKGSTPTAIIYGYNNSLPIAKIEGITYEKAMSLAADIIAKSNEDTDAGKEGLLMKALDDYRNQAAFVNSSVTTYTYDPLIGVTSVTPPTGLREFYKYDTAGRLQSVVDVNNNILKELKYNYKN